MANRVQLLLSDRILGSTMVPTGDTWNYSLSLSRSSISFLSSFPVRFRSLTFLALPSIVSNRALQPVDALHRLPWYPQAVLGCCPPTVGLYSVRLDGGRRRRDRGGERFRVEALLDLLLYSLSLVYPFCSSSPGLLFPSPLDCICIYNYAHEHRNHLIALSYCACSRVVSSGRELSSCEAAGRLRNGADVHPRALLL
jgi:hypothetical protein